MKFVAGSLILALCGSVSVGTLEVAAQETLGCDELQAQYRATRDTLSEAEHDYYVHEIDRCINSADQAGWSETNQFSDVQNAGSVIFSRSTRGDFAIRARTIGDARIASLRPSEAQRLFRAIGKPTRYSSMIAGRQGLARHLTQAIEACYSKTRGQLPYISGIRFERNHIVMAIGHNVSFRFICRVNANGVSIRRILPYNPNVIFAPVDAIPNYGVTVTGFTNKNDQVVGVIFRVTRR